MSARLWGIRWPEWKFDGLDCVPVSFGEAAPFIGEHYPSMFENEPDRFLQEKMTPAKRRYLEECCDVYLFRDAGRTVGVWLGNPTDWASYYARSIGVLPEYRERGVLNGMIENVPGVLREAGLQRLETEVSPTNLPMNRGLLMAGWVVTSTTTSERWGAMLRYTKFLTDDAAQCFRRQFVNGTNIKPRSRPTTE